MTWYDANTPPQPIVLVLFVANAITKEGTFGQKVCCGYRCGGSWTEMSPFGLIPHDNVTKWAYLPEPPIDDVF